jgi:hypothetical protein
MPSRTSVYAGSSGILWNAHSRREIRAEAATSVRTCVVARKSQTNKGTRPIQVPSFFLAPPANDPGHLPVGLGDREHCKTLMPRRIGAAPGTAPGGRYRPTPPPAPPGATSRPYPQSALRQGPCHRSAGHGRRSRVASPDTPDSPDNLGTNSLDRTILLEYTCTDFSVGVTHRRPTNGSPRLPGATPMPPAAPDGPRFLILPTRGLRTSDPGTSAATAEFLQNLGATPAGAGQAFAQAFGKRVKPEFKVVDSIHPDGTKLVSMSLERPRRPPPPRGRWSPFTRREAGWSEGPG